MNGYEQLFLNQLSAIVMASAFIFYLIKKDAQTSQTYRDFNKTIQNHLKHSLKIEVTLTKTLQNLCNVIESLKKEK